VVSESKLLTITAFTYMGKFMFSILGKVIKIMDGVAKIDGLETIRAGEMVEFIGQRVSSSKPNPDKPKPGLSAKAKAKLRLELKRNLNILLFQKVWL